MFKKLKLKSFFLIAIVAILSYSFSKNTHDPTYSNTILTEQENGTWILQINSALTAFEHEVHTNYGKDSYKTPEEFNALVVQHILKNISIKVNNKKDLIFKNGYVKLGHETSAVFEVVGVPKKLSKVLFTNSSFKDVHHNQNTLIILKKGLKKQQFLLSDDNAHSVKLKVSNGQFEKE